MARDARALIDVFLEELERSSWAAPGAASSQLRAMSIQNFLELFTTQGGLEMIAGASHRAHRVSRWDQLEATAAGIADHASDDDPETREVIKYVLVELIRNVLQHSRWHEANVVFQRLRRVGGRAAIEVAVFDEGIGIFEALRGFHPELQTADAAVVKALEPHISGAFEKGLTGTSQNAGLGLFVISELAKRTVGRLLISTRGATVLLEGDEEGNGSIRRLLPRGFPGTLVAFEIDIGEVKDFSALLAVVLEKARARTPGRSAAHWLRYEPAPTDAKRIEIQRRAEDTPAAFELAQRELLPTLLARQPVLLDFAGTPMGTQSYLHTLLFEPLRVAWALKVSIFVVNAEPALRSGLDFVESYALQG